VTPCIVSSPVTSNVSSSSGVIVIDSNVMSGWFSASKKSALRRWSSRWGSFVSIEPALILQ